MFKVLPIILHCTSVLLLMAELDGMKRRDETVSPMGVSVTTLIPLSACFEPYPVPFIIHAKTAAPFS